MLKKMLKQSKGWTITFGLLYLCLIAATIYMLYSISLFKNIENLLRLVGAIFIVLVTIVLIIFSSRAILKNKKVSKIVLLIITLLYSFGLFFLAFNVHKVINKLKKVSTTTTTYSASLVTLADNEAETISDIGTASIGILSDEESVDGNQIPKQIIEKEKINQEQIKEYDDYVSMLRDLYEKKIEYIFLPSGYVIQFQSIEGFENIETETKTLHSDEKEVESAIVSTGSKIDRPITILLMGVDSTKENIKGASFNGDSLMLLTFNPHTLNTTILSIPRDTYVTLCSGKKNKITHAAWGGEKCMITTIQNFTGITIDYYVKINFKGVVKLVDALGGVEVDVPISFCEQNSDRSFYFQVCLEPGLQRLNGEQALALARHRKTINDFVRGQNQQLIVKGIMNQARNIDSIDTVYALLDTISNSLETNMTTEEILSFYDIAKDILSKSKETTKMDELIGIQRLYISGFNAMIYDYKGINLRLYNYVPYKGSVADVTNAMKVNLGLISPTIVKNFSFDVDVPYQETVIGKGTYYDTKLELLPTFIGYNKSEAIAYGNKYGINVEIETVKSEQNKDQVINQSIPAGTDISILSKNTVLTITVSDGTGKIETEDETTLPNFIGKLYNGTTISNFIKKHSTIRIVLVKVSEDDEGYDSSKKGEIISQDVKAGTELDGLIGKTIKLKYVDPGTEQEPDDSGDDNENNNPDSGSSNESNGGDNSNDQNNTPPGDSGNNSDNDSSTDSGNSSNQGNEGSTGSDAGGNNESSTPEEDTSTELPDELQL